VREETGERYQSCDELIAAIDALAASARRPGGRHGAAVRRGTRMLPAAAQGARTLSRQPAQRTRSRLAAKPSSNPWGAVAAGAAAAMLLPQRGIPVLARRTGVGGVPETGWIARGGLRKVQSKGGYGKCVFSTREVERGADDPTAPSAVFSATDPIHGRATFPAPSARTGPARSGKSCGSTAASAAQVIFDPAIPRKKTSSACS